MDGCQCGNHILMELPRRAKSTGTVTRTKSKNLKSTAPVDDAVILLST